jgi:cysteinyl-tRNA synthetase
MIAGRSVALGTPQPRRLHGRRGSGVHVASHQAAGQPRAPAPSRPEPSALRRQLVLGLNLVASALAGAAITILLWNTDTPKPASLEASLDALIIDRYDAASRRETVVYRVPPAELQRRQERPVSSWDAEAEVLADRPVQKTVVHEVKTMKFVAPIEHEITASIAPVARELPAPAAAPMGAPTGKAPDVKNWRYQLAGIDPQAIASSSADLVVIDYAGSKGPFTRAEVEQMRRKPDGSRRLVLAYMSIGQAETYRWYWPQRSSSWLGAKGKRNYSVRFWLADWQKIIFEYTEKIVTAGFDGVYLDHVDEFEDKGHKDDMVEFVARISSKAKARRADFMVVAQNGDALIPNAKFRRAIDAFAREDLFYGEDSEGKRNSAGTIRETIRRLKMLTAEGKPVLVVEYPRNDEQAKTARREISENNFIGLIARRTLNQL